MDVHKDANMDLEPGTDIKMYEDVDTHKDADANANANEIQKN